MVGGSCEDGSSGGAECMSGVVYSDDDSDLSVSDIDEAVLASEFFVTLLLCGRASLKIWSC